MKLHHITHLLHARCFYIHLIFGRNWNGTLQQLFTDFKKKPMIHLLGKIPHNILTYLAIPT
jgi:hypothetical protein